MDRPSPIIEIARLLSNYLFYLSATLIIPLSAAAYFEFIAPETHPQPHSTFAFILTLLTSLILSGLFRFWGRRATGQTRRRESIILVISLWLITCGIAALPFSFSQTFTNPLHAYFEAMSGLTTTGASMLYPKAYSPLGHEIPIYITNPHVPGKTYSFYGTVTPIRDADTGLIIASGVEAVSKAVLLWRSLLQWIGGLGIVVIFLTVLPALKVGGKFLYQTEITGPIKEGISPRIKQTASQLWKLYATLTLLQIIFLMWTNHNIPLFDAICTSLSTISTGGFSVRNGSIADYNSSTTEWVTIIFMLAGSINFALYFEILKGKFKKLCTPDFILFIIIVISGSALISFFLTGTDKTAFTVDSEIYSFGEALRAGIFQAVSVQTSTGFTTANYDVWPFPSQMFMLLLMFVGGMSGSTAGGIKTSRFYILYKIILYRLESIYRPDAVRIFKIGQTEIDDKNSLTVLAFFCIVAFFTVLGTVILILDGVDPETALGLMGCFLNNVGAAFRSAGPNDSFAILPPFSECMSIIWMLLGRLEYYILLLILLPSFWKHE